MSLALGLEKFPQSDVTFPKPSYRKLPGLTWVATAKFLTQASRPGGLLTMPKICATCSASNLSSIRTSFRTTQARQIWTLLFLWRSLNSSSDNRVTDLHQGTDMHRRLNSNIVVHSLGSLGKGEYGLLARLFAVQQELQANTLHSAIHIKG